MRGSEFRLQSPIRVGGIAGFSPGGWHDYFCLLEISHRYIEIWSV